MVFVNPSTRNQKVVWIVCEKIHQLDNLYGVDMIRTKKIKPKGINPLIKALRDSHHGADKVANIIEKWKEDQIISDTDIAIVDEWLKLGTCDNSRKIARCIVRCICDNWLECP